MDACKRVPFQIRKGQDGVDNSQSVPDLGGRVLGIVITKKVISLLTLADIGSTKPRLLVHGFHLKKG